MLQRLRNLWRMSEIEVPQIKTKTTLTKWAESIQGKKMATIIEMSEPAEQFPSMNEHGEVIEQIS